jgi:hypothetical protein
LSQDPALQRPSRPGALAAAALVVLVIAGAAAVGFAVAGLIPASFQPASTGSSAAIAATPVPLPAADVTGEDLVALPRYPGSWRTAFHRETQGGTLVTNLAYVTDAELDDVRGYYRGVFRQHGWEVIELDFSLTQWVFLVSSGQDVALVTFESQEGNVVIEVELEQPQLITTTPPQPSVPAVPVRPAPPPPAPPAEDDGSDDDG